MEEKGRVESARSEAFERLFPVQLSETVPWKSPRVELHSPVRISFH